MKKRFLIIASLTPLFIYSQSTVDITPKVKNAVLYLNGALVTHEGGVSLEPGKTTIVFHGIPSHIDKQSIQLASDGDIIILSVTSHKDFLAGSKKNSKVLKWQDSLNLLSEDVESNKNTISILTDAKKLLDDNRTVGGANTGTSVLAVKSMFEYYVKQVNSIDDSLMKLNKKETRLETRIKKISDEITEWRSKTDTIASEVEASVSSDKKQDVNFRLSYLTYDANWSPLYDLRVQDTKHPCKFSYKANISQHTGQDWDNVDLTISSANPIISQTAPVLNPWYLLFYQPVYKSEVSGADVNVRGSRSDAMAYSIAGKSEAPEEKNFSTQAIQNTTQETNLAVEFHIESPYSLASDNKPHTLEIKQYDLHADYHYICIPKLQKDVFLLAGITQWEDLNILAGEVNIYYTGAYVGKSHVSPENISDTLNFSLGMDKKVVVKRTKTKSFASTHWIGTNETQDFGWEISLHNSQNDSVAVDVFDQIPLSTDKDIVITPVDLGGSSENETGKLTWHISLAAGETKKLTFSYSVKYPKDKTIQNLWQ